MKIFGPKPYRPQNMTISATMYTISATLCAGTWCTLAWLRKFLTVS